MTPTAVNALRYVVDHFPILVMLDLMAVKDSACSCAVSLVLTGPPRETGGSMHENHAKSKMKETEGNEFLWKLIGQIDSRDNSESDGGGPKPEPRKLAELWMSKSSLSEAFSTPAYSSLSLIR